nr:hypothetical protein [Oscillochloris trichoides]
MPYTVWGAFDKFRKDCIDLSDTSTKTAIASRDYLFDQIKALAQNNNSFPRLSGGYLKFGSFARKTKIQPLDDIDILVLLNGKGTVSSISPSDPFTYWLKINDENASLATFPDAYGYVDSNKVMYRIRDLLKTISNYSKAEIHKKLNAVTLKLTSYPWVFDIVPAVPINDGQGGIGYYLIPNGLGKWIRTDPRKDSDIITSFNTTHNSKFIPTVRLLKYWNARTHKPRLMSYYIETLAIKVFQYATPINEYHSAVKYFFDNCPLYLNISCPDPKGLGPNLDLNIDQQAKQKVSDAMREATGFIYNASIASNVQDEKTAIYWWGRVFGSSFPSYGS